MSRADSEIFGVRPIREAVFVWLLIVAASLTAITAIGFKAVDYEKATIENELTYLAAVASTLINPIEHGKLERAEDTGSAQYMRLIKPLVDFHLAVPELFYVYTAIKRDDQYLFVLDTAQYVGALRPDISLIHTVVMERYNDPDPKLVEAFASGKPTIGGFFTDEYGTFKSAFAPFHNADGSVAGVVGVDIDTGDHSARISAVIRLCVNGFLLLLVLASLLGLITYAVRKRTLHTLLDNSSERREQEAVIEQKRKENDTLLINILPSHVAQRVKDGEKVIADQFDRVTVMFIDLVGFTRFSSPFSPRETVEFLNRIFSALDNLTVAHRLEKIKTIGDSYMVVGGLDPLDTDHMRRVASMALDALSVFDDLRKELRIHEFSVQIGIDTGPVIAGVIGNFKFAYDLWGNTVNIASLLQASSQPDRIQCSANFVKYIQSEFEFEDRGEVELNRKGKMRTFFLNDAKKTL